MALAYFPLFPADFEADTAHLSLAEDGAYNRLLRLMWRAPGCTLPDDAAWLARRLRVTMEEFQTVVCPVLEEFFTSSRGRISNKRLGEIYVKVHATHAKLSEAGKKGGSAKAIEKKGNDAKPGLSRDQAGLKQPEPEPEPLKKEAKASQKKESPTAARGSRIAPDWQLPISWGQWAMDQGLSEQQVRAEADQFKDYWIAKTGATATKLDWLATWRNWIRTAIKRSPRRGTQNDRRQENLAFSQAISQVADGIASGTIGLQSANRDPWNGAGRASPDPYPGE